ncbi:hypothetical protein Salat_1225300 [Sesamum alatum]|uniref:Uncharacterized protein n=1 Tax=Sesamum alatum TaxID=300844 RepID=A0AAE1YFC1_9LAMI|nr:hypothetical protein Salat_1225300 [Sesamum alatum]
MGKKKAVRRTKEVLVALAESSAAEPVQTPRKRGRPRKVIEKNEEEQEVGGADSKKARTGEGDEEKKVEEIEGEMVGSKGVEGVSMKQEEEGPRRSRRKSKPRKSS